MTLPPNSKYIQNFRDLVDDPSFGSRLNEMKIFAKPMRTGKNYDEIHDRIPYLFNNHGIVLNIQVSPLTGIIIENEEMIKEICRINSWYYENDPENILRNIEKGVPTVVYWTNAMAYTSTNPKILYEELIKLGVMDRVSITADEMDTWSMSHFSQAKLVKGIDMKSEAIYRASLYKTISKIGMYSPYVFGLTATANFEVSGLVDTYINLDYILENPLVPGEQIEYAHQVGWFGSATFYGIGLADNREEVFQQLLKRSFAIESRTRLKRASLLQCGNEYKSDYTKPDNSNNLNPPEVKQLLVKHRNLIPHPDTTEMICIMDSDTGQTTYDLLGNEVDTKLTEKDVYRRINDLTDPLRFLLVKMKAGRSITMPTVKNVMTFRITDKHSELGSITEPPEQFIGRAKSVMVGIAQEDFSSKYGRDIRNVPGFNEEANCYDVYLPDTSMYRNAVEKHLTFDACTPHMLGLEHDSENCPQCGAEPQHQKNTIHSVEVKDDEIEIFAQEKVNEQLDMVIN